MKYDISVAWIDSGYTRSEFTYSLLNLSKKGYFSNFFRNSSPLLSYNRNYVVNQFLESGGDWLLMLDSDILITEEILQDMMNVINLYGAKIVTAPYYVVLGDDILLAAQRLQDQEISWAKYDKNKIYDDIVAAGLGCILIHKDVFNAIKFQNTNKYPWFADFSNDESSISWVGEDIFFCNKVVESGYKIYLSCNNVAKHLKTIAIDSNSKT